VHKRVANLTGMCEDISLTASVTTRPLARFSRPECAAKFHLSHHPSAENVASAWRSAGMASVRNCQFTIGGIMLFLLLCFSFTRCAPIFK